jgi:hypothetical protein
MIHDFIGMRRHLGALLVGLWLAAVCAADTPVLSPGVEDIGKLAAAKVGDETILAYVRNSKSTFHLTSDDIIYLNGRGVSQAVMTSLLQGGAAPAPSTPTAPPSAPSTPSSPSPAGAPSSPVSPSTPGVTYYPGGQTPAESQAVPTPTAPPPDGSAAANAQVNFDYFHQQLSPYGTWVRVDPWGWVWRPAASFADPEWRPYCQGGHWVYTDQGWYWQAEDPWGSVVFHYGRWDLDPVYGWIWVPGYNWAPAWVCWRHSPGYYGWAPLPPHAEFVVGVGLRWHGAPVAAGFDFGLRYGAFTFVAYDHLWARDYAVVRVPHERVEFIFRSSEIRNEYRCEHGCFLVVGFGRDHVREHTGRVVEVVEVRRQVAVEHGVVVRSVASPRNVEVRAHVAAGRPGPQPVRRAQGRNDRR